jgi:hypothetical protein
VATVQAYGTVLANGGGVAMIVAQAGAAADTLRLTVTPAPQVLARLVASPDTVTLNPGGSVTIQVQAFDTRGNGMTVPPLTWSGPASGITVTSAGVIQAAASITTPIPATAIVVSSGVISARIVASVTIPPVPLARLVVTPDTVTLSPGAAIAISVQAIDARGNTISPAPAVSWQSLTNGIDVTGNGVITAETTITATMNGVVQVSSGAITTQVRVGVIVNPPAPSDGGYVQIRWVGAMPAPSIVAAFESARLKINGLFKSFNGVAAINPGLPAGACMTGAAALDETVPGIIIFAQVTAIDGAGGILGSAGPCLVRNANWIPIVGAMQFDVADLDYMVTSGTLNGVVLHEMMHTLGFGTIWFPGYQDEVPLPNGSDPRYFGSTGQAGYAAVGGTDWSNGVPVENTGGSGTRGSHWRESVFHSELMTGWADGSMAMSQATVGALKDFGYDVDINKADPFSLATSLRSTSLVAARQIGEQTVVPLFMLDRNGKIARFTGSGTQ